MKPIKILMFIILFLPSIFFFSLGIGGILPFVHLKEKNTFLIIGIFYLLFSLLFIYRNREKKEIDSYDIFFYTLFLYSIASIPKLLNLTYFAEHFVYLANSFTHLRLDILPCGYIDDPVIFNDKV